MFGMGFTEILIIAVIAILFLGPDKLPSTMVEVAKFFRSVKKTIVTVKDSLEEELNVADIKEEALAYKKELLSASGELKRVTDVSQIGASLTNLSDDFLDDEIESKTKKEKKEPVKPEKVTFEKKSTKIEKEDAADV
ncbi:twin-arginine translocation protein TatB [Sulfurimonas gotlandica GD1]|jgi:sec-independent protein translocase protein TatB|uniref:Sec-independent protein translocase protein TatB homolog n=1 Tax=Sulfurimonas gotlandica (strain DSM 19862 / JCM 16533 / GD1) TaxID=929558 RepID=H1FW09_SULGG|nr:Sec-independent protein translocase protein TatB [Sulfurimonas gotlandica]EHP30391.1 twin-arginine translocation protein TatB [Sulfurimonas gotlandica GD1]